MIKISLNLIILVSFCFIGFSQEKYEDIYIYTKRQSFFGANGEYTTHFSIKSKEEPFSHDNYNFQISDPKWKESSLYNLGQRIHKDSLTFIDPIVYFNNKSACETHNELSMMSIRYKKRIFIVTEIHPEILIRETDKTKKYMVWEAVYSGTVKDFTYTQLGKGPFFK